MPSASVSPPAASPPALTTPDTIIAQHILVAYKTAKRAPKGVTRSKADAKARAAEALGAIRGGMTFEDAVAKYSDDAGSADRLGSVGKFRREDMAPAFSAAAFALRVGQLSEVVETPFGFHIIKRTQ
jgi:parvulin-like peptidyl-prolyl isomerase